MRERIKNVREIYLVTLRMIGGDNFNHCIHRPNEAWDYIGGTVMNDILVHAVVICAIIAP